MICRRDLYSISKSKNGLLDQKLRKIKDNLGKPGKQRGKDQIQRKIVDPRLGAMGIVNLTYVEILNNMTLIHRDYPDYTLFS